MDNAIGSVNIFNLNSLTSSLALDAYNLSEALIEEICTLLRAGLCLQFSSSHAKDSSTVTNAGIEAMRRCIERGEIEPERPLVILTVDTLLEPENIQCYVPVSYEHIKSTCESYGINLIIKIVSPPIHQQLMVLFAGVQKLFSSSMSGRSGDCSVIWKIDTMRRSLKAIKESLPLKYQQSTWASVTGSRSSESVRRKLNMRKIGVNDLKSTKLLSIIDNEGTKAFSKVYNFAPIADWSTPDVINYLNHAGDKPCSLTLPNQRIPAYIDNFGLLLAIYGEGGSDTCEIVMDDAMDKGGSSCNGTARYGCTVCGMVSKDHSGLSMRELPRWGRFGDSFTRLRDYFIRTSVDVQYRAFHPRAMCSVTSNVYLQPNVLKANVLEKLVYFGAQMTEDYKQAHLDFKACYERGEIESDIGVKDIMSDTSMSFDVREQYRDAYIARMLKSPLYDLFSEKHAVLLSFLWTLHGVNTSPYRPVKILSNVRKGKRIPFPKTNDELNELRAQQGLKAWDHKDVLNRDIPDARAYQLFTPPQDTLKGLQSSLNRKVTETDLINLLPINMESYWLQNNKSLMLDSNGFQITRLTNLPLHTRRIKLKYTFDPLTKEEVIKTQCMQLNRTIELSAYSEIYAQVVCAGRELLSASLRLDEAIYDLDVLQSHSLGMEPLSLTTTMEMNFCKSFESTIIGVSGNPRKRPSTGLRFSRRKRDFSKQGVKIGRASLKDYNPTVSPALHEQHQSAIKYWLPDLSQKLAFQFDLANYHHNDVNLTEYTPYYFDEACFSTWLEKGFDSLVIEHDRFVSTARDNKLQARCYSGVEPCHKLLLGTGLVISSKFERYVQFSLARTQLFHECRLFRLSTKSLSFIDSAKGVISMAEQRRQKAEQLLAVRYLRNEKRKEVSELLKQNTQQRKNQALTSIMARLSEFHEHYRKVCESKLATQTVYALTQKPKEILHVMDYWLAEFTPLCCSPEKALSVLATEKERIALCNDLESVKQFAIAFSELLNDTKRHILGIIETTNNKFNSVVSQVLEEELFVDDLNNIEMNDESNAMFIGEWLKSQSVVGNSYLMAHGIIKYSVFSIGLHCTAEVQRGSSSRLEQRKKLAQELFHYIDDLSCQSVEALERLLLSKHSKIDRVAVMNCERKATLAELRAIASHGRN
ncbi:phosphoadenosine phosphosulfate reductase domain-containing protein [Aliivibrio fischeri]|uniref:phosphoadenosine phosphosulfate reductase domain-containing protein n=1 Tax=Aliivibrio fischeri TaxID=668 RepID=UPI0007C4F260|nr:phosphoadenosine phosphosulfate reductase family protein [Aliivibrio fischeri]